MAKFFTPGKWYLLDKTKRTEFVEQATSINTAIAEVLEDKPFQVKLNDDRDEVIEINFGDEWVSRTQALPSMSGQNYGFAWFYKDEAGEEVEYECFDEVDEPEDPNVKNCIVVLTEDDSSGNEYWNGTRRAVGGANPTMFTMSEAKEVVENFLSNTTDERAKAEIFTLKTTAQVVKEIKFS